MRILFSHNYYRSSAPSGEDAVFQNERALLKSAGNDVITFERRNDDIDDSSLTSRIRIAREGAWSGKTYDDVTRLLRKVMPDIAHFHNTFPLISPSAYAACKEQHVPVIQTLHNYRLVCPGALLQRDGRPCEDCLGTSLLPALRHRCYRDSLPATSAVVWMLLRNRLMGSYHRLVDRYIALTEFSATRLIAGGLPADRIAVKPNFLPDPPMAGDSRDNYAIYVGRLSQEKGVLTLIEAFEHVPDIPLRIFGDGPLRIELERKAEMRGLKIEFMGYQPRAEILEHVRKAQFLVIPSEWYEGFPMVVLEAYASGTPVLASRIGSLDEIIVDDETGIKFEPGNAMDMAEKLRLLFTDSSLREHMSRGACALFEEKYTAEKNLEQLLAIYEQALSGNPLTATVKPR